MNIVSCIIMMYRLVSDLNENKIHMLGNVFCMLSFQIWIWKGQYKNKYFYIQNAFSVATYFFPKYICSYYDLLCRLSMTYLSLSLSHHFSSIVAYVTLYVTFDFNGVIYVLGNVIDSQLALLILVIKSYWKIV